MTTTSREYAEALFELAVQAGLTKETSDGLETVISALLQTPAYRALLASPAIAKEERLNALDSTFRGKIPDILLAILRMMVSDGGAARETGKEAGPEGYASVPGRSGTDRRHPRGSGRPRD